MTTVVAFAAWNVMEDHDPIARFELTNLTAHGRYDTRGFVSKNARRRMRTARDFLEIGSTDAASVYPDQQFALPNLRYRNGFDPNVVDAAIDGCSHGGRNRPLRFFDRKLPRDGHLSLP